MNFNENIIKDDLIERFIRYVKIDTQSQEDVEQIPSTKKQFDLANILVKELKELGLEDANVDSHSYVMATLPGNLSPVENDKIPKIGFIAHLDTSPEAPGENVNPIIHKNYDGKDLKLPKNNIILKPEENPHLKDCIGGEIITSDGSTLLGADDKAGIAEILSSLVYLKKNPDIKHGDIKIAFTPDEEVGRGADLFDVKKFNADLAYTLDGSIMGEIENETFNAYSANISVKGFNVHPGDAKDKMVNSMRIAAHLISQLPENRLPETTEQREGYIHVHNIKGSVDETIIKLLLRDFEMDGIKESEKILQSIIANTKKTFPKSDIQLETKESYLNMKYKLDENPDVVELALEAVKRSNIKPILGLIRGGTDGARLSYMGLLTPNIFTGGQNFHSVSEWIPVKAMIKATETAVNLIKIFVEKYNK